MAKSLSDQAGFLIVANLIKYAVGFIMPMVLVRLVSQSDYGSYQQLILVGTAITGVLTLGLPMSIYYFYHYAGSAKRPALVMQTTLLLIAAGAVATAATWLSASELAARLNNPAVSGLLQLYALSLFFTIASEHCLHVMIAQNRYGMAVAFEIGETVVRVLTLLAPLYWGLGIHGLVIGIVVYSGLRFCVRNTYLLNCSGLQFSGWKMHAFVPEQMAYSIPVALVALSGLVSSTLNRGMLAASFTPAHYAIYAVGALEIPLDVIFQASVANVLRARLPSLVKDGNLEEIARLMREATRKLSIIVIPSFVFLLGHSHEFITLLFTSHYAESVHIFHIYLWLIPLHMLVLSAIPQAFGKPKLNLYTVVAMNALLLLLGYVLLKYVGFYGPALATVITQYAQSIVFFLIARKLTGASLRQLLSVRHLLQVAAAALIGLGASYFLGQFIEAGLLHLVFAGITFSMAFFIAAAFLRVFSKDDIDLIRRWAGKLVPYKFA